MSIKKSDYRYLSLRFFKKNYLDELKGRLERIQNGDTEAEIESPHKYLNFEGLLPWENPERIGVNGKKGKPLRAENIACMLETLCAIAKPFESTVNLGNAEANSDERDPDNSASSEYVPSETSVAHSDFVRYLWSKLTYKTAPAEAVDIFRDLSDEFKGGAERFVDRINWTFDGEPRPCVPVSGYPGDNVRSVVHSIAMFLRALEFDEDRDADTYAGGGGDNDNYIGFVKMHTTIYFGLVSGEPVDTGRYNMDSEGDSAYKCLREGAAAWFEPFTKLAPNNGLLERGGPLAWSEVEGLGGTIGNFKFHVCCDTAQVVDGSSINDIGWPHGIRFTIIKTGYNITPDSECTDPVEGVSRCEVSYSSTSVSEEQTNASYVSAVSEIKPILEAQEFVVTETQMSGTVHVVVPCGAGSEGKSGLHPFLDFSGSVFRTTVRVTYSNNRFRRVVLKPVVFNRAERLDYVSEGGIYYMVFSADIKDIYGSTCMASFTDLGLEMKEILDDWNNGGDTYGPSTSVSMTLEYDGALEAPGTVGEISIKYSSASQATP